jgi:ADP-ribose pyrophosphatase YjhB (NUDIX family)
MSRTPIDTHNGSAVFENDRGLQPVSYRGTAVSHNFKFNLKHIFRGGAIIWCKHNGQDYYVVFRSKTRPNRGVQLPGGRIERNENPAEAILREVQEESGIDSKVICPLGMIYFENQEDNYSSLQIYYLVRPEANLDVTKRWKYIDKDHTKQELECWFEPVSKDPEFLSAGQAEVVYMFRQWLKEHKKPLKTPKKTFKSKKKPWFKKK